MRVNDQLGSDITDFFYDLEVTVIMRRDQISNYTQLIAYRSISAYFSQLVLVKDHQGNSLGSRQVAFGVIAPKSRYESTYSLIVAIFDEFDPSLGPDEPQTNQFILQRYEFKPDQNFIKTSSDAHRVFAGHCAS